MNIHFSLRQQGSSDPIILLNVFDKRFPQRKFQFSTGQRIAVADWKKAKGANSTRGFPKDRPVTSALIGHLQHLQRTTQDWLNTKIGERSLSREELSKALKGEDEQQEPEKDIFHVWREIIDNTRNKSGMAIVPNTRKSKMQTLNLVARYAATKNLKLTFMSFDRKFEKDFDRWMIKDGLSDNTRGGHIKGIKAILREAEKDVPVNPAYKDYKVTKRDVHKPYLSLSDLQKIADLKIGTGEKDITARQAELRDLFVAACFVGVRFSDWRQIHPDNIVEESKRDRETGAYTSVQILKITQKKQANDGLDPTVYVPIHPKVSAFIEKYRVVGPPKMISGDKFRKTIKVICKKALVDNEDKPLTVMLNGEKIEKYKTVGTHTARRSIATNMYLSGEPIHAIMRVTGHKSESTCRRYIKVSDIDHAIISSASKFFTDETLSPLKIAR